MFGSEIGEVELGWGGGTRLRFPQQQRHGSRSVETEIGPICDIRSLIAESPFGMKGRIVFSKANVTKAQIRKTSQRELHRYRIGQ
jgi:hypothetical protein